MKILLITGGPGVGKSSIASLLCENQDFNLIRSYTNRPARAKEFDHMFVSDNQMKDLLIHYKCVASTCIDGYYYCAFEQQFDPEKINVYVVDVNGIRDTMASFSSELFMTVLITRKNIDIDQKRKNRHVNIPSRNQVDFVIENDADSLEGSVGVLKYLTLKDDGLFFKNYRRPIISIEEEIREHRRAIDRHMSEIRHLQGLLNVYR